ncbi:MAG TPA: phosphatidylglycerophosphatase A [Candidatus Sulfotelmatobacter sp.]|nr:phosphatidylglycerophosphatase A [Candidatus Sulfotelmatobacter sp.]
MKPGLDGSAGDPAVSAAASGPRAPGWATVIATFGGIGRMRPGPGTWASAATVVLWASIAYLAAPALRTPLAVALAVLVTLAGIPAASRVAQAAAVKDPQFVVIDEVAGQLIALIAVPLAWKTFLAGFILFRVFDILKPPPVRQVERLPGGTGIVLDDVAAGIFAFLGIHLLLHFALLK